MAKRNELANIIKESSKEISRDDYFKFLTHSLEDYSSLVFTEEEMQLVQKQLQRLSTGSTSTSPMTCTGPACYAADKCELQKMGRAPIGRSCHPPGTKILTTAHGEILIEDLDPTLHSLVGFEKKRTAIRRGMIEDKIGFSFKKGIRDFEGTLVTLKTPTGKEHSCTFDHICFARFTEEAVGKFCVYLMKKGENYRVGKSMVLQESHTVKSKGKYYIPVVMRGIVEEADALWILGIYNTNTEALLMEEYFSCSFQAPKAIFLLPKRFNDRKKWDGLYAWATQEQLDNHHKKFIQPKEVWESRLKEIGLSFDYPFWVKDNKTKTTTDEKVYSKSIMNIRACNLLSGIMEVPVIPEKEIIYKTKLRSYRVTDWERIEVTKEKYKGKVYSLEVETHESYFANKIATHNCIIEVQLLNYWIMQYMNEYEVDPENFTEVSMCNELAEIEMLINRLNWALSRPENAELIIDQAIGADRNGDPVMQKQLSPYMIQKEKLQKRKTQLTKLMVGDRQEKYKKEAALKQREELDPSSKQAEMRRKLDELARSMESLSTKKAENILTPDAIISALDD